MIYNIWTDAHHAHLSVKLFLFWQAHLHESRAEQQEVDHNFESYISLTIYIRLGIEDKHAD